MRFFKDENGSVWAYESHAAPTEMRVGLVPMTPEEIEAHLNPVKSLQELAAAAMAQVNAEYARRMGAIADDYPLHERESWPVQLQEARELQSDPDAVTPWLDQCAAQRGMTREELAGRIAAKDLAYREVSGFLTGVRQKHEDEIKALESAGEASREALQDYHWSEYWDGEALPDEEPEQEPETEPETTPEPEPEP